MGARGGCRVKSFLLFFNGISTNIMMTCGYGVWCIGGGIDLGGGEGEGLPSESGGRADAAVGL